MKTVEYYNDRIETLRVTIRRLNAEKRAAILRKRERVLKRNGAQEVAVLEGQTDER